MTKKFKFAHVIVGEVPARNRSQAYMLVQMSISIASRLLNSPCKISLKVAEMVDQKPEDQRINLNRILEEVRKEKEESN